MSDFYSGEGTHGVGTWWMPFSAILLFTLSSTYFFFQGKDVAAVVTGLIPVATVGFLMAVFKRDWLDMLPAVFAILFFLFLLNIEVLNKRKYALMSAIPAKWMVAMIAILILLLSFSVFTDVFMR